MSKIDFIIADDFVKNNPQNQYLIQNDNDYVKEWFIAKPLGKRTFFNRMKHSFNVLRGVAEPVYYFETIQKFYPKKINDYLNYRKKV